MKFRSFSALRVRRARDLALANALVRLRETHVQQCQHIIGYTFNNKELIREALTPGSGVKGNQRLAVAGDKAADLHLATQWYYGTSGTKWPLTPAQWSYMKADLLSNANLAKVGFSLRMLDGGAGASPCSSSAMATAVEAVIGAVWFDSKGDPAALRSVMQKFGLTTHPLLSHRPPEKPAIWSDRLLPTRFFNGHHSALLQLGKGPDTLPTGVWSRFKSILFTPKVVVDTAQESFAAPPGRKHNRQGQEPRPRKSTKAPEQHASAPVPATNKQTPPAHSSSTRNSSPPTQASIACSARRRDLLFAWSLKKDAERKRISWFIWSVEWDESMISADRENMLDRLKGHRKLLDTFPNKSLKDIVDDSSTSGLYLTKHSADEPYDNILAQHIKFVARVLRRLNQRSQRGRRPPDEEDLRQKTAAQLRDLWRARLELWLPPNAQASRMPTSLPESGPTSASPSEPPSPGLPATPAIDSMESLNPLPPGDPRPDRPDSVLWTTKVAQRKSVDWKHYLSKPTTAHDGVMQSESRKL